MVMKKQLALLALILTPTAATLAQCPSASFTSTAPACQNTNVDFTNTSGNTGGGWSYFWDFDYPNQGGANPNTSTNQNPNGVDYSGGGNGTYTVEFTITNSGLGCSSTVLMDIDIRRARADFMTSASSACIGDSLLCYNMGTPGSSPTTTVTHSWSFGAGANPSTSNAANPPAVTYTTSGPKTITHYVSVDYGGCGGVRDDVFTQTISVNPTPTLSFTSNAPVCMNQAVDFNYTGTNAVGYSWDFGADASPQTSFAQNPSGIMYSTSGSKDITLEAVNNYGCSSNYVGSITIDPVPVATFTSNSSYCTGDLVDFQNTGTTGASYSWDLGAGSSPGASTNENPTGILYSTPGIKSVVLTTTLGSCSESQTQTINIAETPAPSFTTNSPQCEGADLNITYTGTSDPNWTYLWDLGVGSTPSSATQQNPQSILYSGAGSKTMFLTVTNGLCSESTSASISIDALPIANAGFDTTICADMSVMIGSASVAGNTYSWAPGSTLDDVAISAPTASPDANNTEYIVLVTNTSTGCSNSDSITVLMQDPLIANANIDAEICYGDSFQIGTGLIEGQDYVWTPSAGLSDPTLPNPISTPDSTTVYTLAVSGGGCGPVMDEVTIIVHPLPLANAGIDDTITTGSSTQLIATGGVQYEWNPFYALDNSGVFNPIASPSTTTEYSVIVTDIYGCVNSDTVVVFVIEPSFWLPNGFTPDGNGNNDILYVRGEGITDFQFRIFNKWGELIFYTNKLEEGWNGHRLLSDEAMPVGAYVYHVSGVLSNGEPVITEGIVNLIR